MGLDIRAFSGLAWDHDARDNCDHYGEDLEVLRPSEDFLAQADGLKRGCYTYTDKMHFRAGSYSGYNDWRDELSMLATGKSANAVWEETPADAGLPFQEMISFTDCDGVIGPKTSAKLLKDFQEWRGRAEEFAAAMPGDEGEWFMRIYNDFEKAFELAADGGAVEFC